MTDNPLTGSLIITAGPDELSGSPAPLAMSASDRERLRKILELRDSFVQADRDVRDEIGAAIAEHSTAAALADTQVGSELESMTGAALSKAIAADNEVGTLLAKQVTPVAERALGAASSVGITGDYQPWERELYAQLPRAEAYAVASAIKADPTLSSVDASVLAAEAIIGDGDIHTKPPVEGPVVSPPPTSLPSCKSGFAIDRTGCPKPDIVPRFDGIGPGGWYWFGSEADSTALLGEDVIVFPSTDAPRYPTYAEIFIARGAWCTGIEWDGSSWKGTGQGQNPPLCAVTGCYEAPVPPVPPTPPTPIPPSPIPGIPGDTCPAPTVIYEPMPLPPGYGIVPVQTCPVNPGGGSTSPPGSGSTLPPSPTIPLPPPPTIILPPPLTVSPPTTGPSPPGPFTSACYPLDNPDTVCGTLQGPTFGSSSDAGGVTTVVGGFVEGVIEGVGDVLSWFANGIASLTGNERAQSIVAELTGMTDAAKELLNGKLACDTCTPSAYLGIMSRIGLANHAESITGMPISYLFQDLTYRMQYLCPQLLPGQAAIDDMWVKGALTSQQYECYTRALGNLPHLAGKAAELTRTKIDIHDCIKLFRLEEIDADEYYFRLSQLGVMDANDRIRIETAFDDIPSPAQLTRYMIRDVANPAAVAAGDLTQGFAENWQGDIRKWGYAQGYTDEDALNDWMAHWVYPSDTQLFEMVARNRQGRVDDNLVVSHQDAVDLLGINDLAPAWRDKVLSISYLTPTRSDLKQGWLYDYLERDEVYQGLLDTKLDHAGATIVMKIYDGEKKRTQAAINARRSAWTPKAVAKAVADGSLSTEDATQQLQYLGLDDDAITMLIGGALAYADTQAKKVCIAATRRQFMHGALDQRAAFDALEGFQIDPKLALTIRDRWNCERAMRSKEVPAAKNVAWFKSGVITLEQLGVRLINLGYTQENTDEYMADAIVAVQKARAAADKKAAAELKKARAELEKKQAADAAKEEKCKKDAAKRRGEPYEDPSCPYEDQVVNDPPPVPTTPPAGPSPAGGG